MKWKNSHNFVHHQQHQQHHPPSSSQPTHRPLTTKLQYPTSASVFPSCPSLLSRRRFAVLVTMDTLSSTSTCVASAGSSTHTRKGLLGGSGLTPLPGEPPRSWLTTVLVHKDLNCSPCQPHHRWLAAVSGLETTGPATSGTRSLHTEKWWVMHMGELRCPIIF